MEVDPSLIHRLFYPQVPALLAAESGGKVSAMPVVSYAAVSTAPPIVVVSCDPSSFTFKLASRARAFSLSLLDRKHLNPIEKLASTSGRNFRDKLAAAGLSHEHGKKARAPVISGAAATIECTLSSKRRMGDHVLLFGVVEAAYASRDFSGFWGFRRYRPILYTGWRDGMSTYAPG